MTQTELTPEPAAEREAGLARLGTLLLESGHSVTDTRVALEQVQRAIAPGEPLSFAVLPEAVFVGHHAGPATMRISEGPPMSMRQAAVLVPGALITNALLELTASDIVTGAARLVSGLVMLGFMAAGIMAGAAMTGLSIDPGSVALIGDAPAEAAMSEGWLAVPPEWFVWPGVVALAVGIAFVFGATGALAWVTIAAMAAAYLLLSVLSPLTGGILATGITAMVLFIMSRLLEQAPSGVPSAVSFQPAFLLLVPGTVGLVALASFDPAGLSATPLTFVSLCIGTKLAAALSDFARSLAQPVKRIARRPPH